MDTFRHDLRYALRALARRPGFTLAALVTLALGIGATTAALLRLADRNGLDGLGISVERGRLFESTDRDGALPVALVNEAAARRFWPGEDPLGKRISVGVQFGYQHDEWTLVGVIENIRALSLLEESEPERANTRFYLMLLTIFAACAVTLAAVGIYGVVAFVVARRRREIGVRLALGARIREVVALVVWQGVSPGLIGLAIGVAGAAAGGRVIAGLLFDVKPLDPLTYAGVTLLLLAVVGLACIVPAARAVRIPPARALRAD